MTSAPTVTIVNLDSADAAGPDLPAAPPVPAGAGAATGPMPRVAEEPTEPHEVMNTVLHHALRRDLRRVGEILQDPVGTRRRLAIADQLRFLLTQLHHHHTVEDELIWPAVLAVRPDLDSLFEQMEGEHARLGWVVERLGAAADAWEASADPRNRAAVRLATLDLLTVLEPHLDHEESTAMPVIATTLTAREWTALDKQLRPKGSPATLARQLFWLLDELDEKRAAVVRGLVPTPVLRGLRLAFGRREFRRAQLLWG